MKEFCPHNYQQYCIDRIIRDPALGLFLDMGLGKTAITLTAIKRLKYEYWAVRKVLVIAPKKVAESTWDKEAAKWSHLSCLRLVHVLGSVGQRTAALAQTADVYLINRENVQWLVGYYGHSWPFDMVVIDESSSFKNHQAKRFKALKLVRSRINRIVELTGTPNPRSLMDLWAQVYLLDCGQRLGRTITSYRDAYFVPDKRSRTTIFSYAPKLGAADEIYRRISDICISMKSEDYGTMDRINAWNKHRFATKVVGEAARAAKKTAVGKGLTNDQLVAQISRYATKNRSAAMAEAVADYRANGSRAKPLCQAIWKILKRELG